MAVGSARPTSPSSFYPKNSEGANHAISIFGASKRYKAIAKPRSGSVDETLRTALNRLRSKRDRLKRQMAPIYLALRGGDDMGAGRAGKVRAQKGMSSATRKAISRRIKAYWAKRKQTAGKNAG